MESWFPVFFQWFVLISAACLAALVCRSFILSLAASRAGAALSTDETPPACGGRPFYTAGQPVFWQIVMLAALSRAVLYGIAYLASRIYIGSDGSFLGSIPALWQRSDANHYVAIAKNWYVSSGEDRVFLVFLPFYPILIKLFAFAFGSEVLSGIAISLLCYCAACVLIYEVALLIGCDDGAAYGAVKCAVFFPASFFVNGAFNEGLFLLLSALFFHCLLRKKWIASGCFGLLASFTRDYGLLLALPYAMELALDAAARKPSLKFVMPRALPILLIPAGTAAYLCVNYAVSGNFLQFLIYQKEHWNQGFGFFFNGMRSLAANALTFDRATSATLFIPQLIAVILFIFLLAYGVIKKFHVSLLAYLGAYCLMSISTSWMLSFPRYMFGAFPIFSLMAAPGAKSRAADALITFVCAAGLIYLAVAYACGFHVY